MPSQTRKHTKVVDTQINEGAARVLEIGPNMTPQAHLLWLPPSEIEYFDLPSQRDLYEGEREMPELYQDLYKDCLDIYKGKKVYYGDALDAGSYVQGKYDVVFASHILEHIPWHLTNVAIEEWVGLLNPGGALHIIVPSLEWCAEEALKDNPSKALLPVLCGGQAQEGDAHLCMFTMRYLRARMEKAGLHVMHAVSGERDIHIGDGETVPSDQHYAVGLYLPEGTPLPPLEKE